MDTFKNILFWSGLAGVISFIAFGSSLFPSLPVPLPVLGVVAAAVVSVFSEASHG